MCLTFLLAVLLRVAPLQRRVLPFCRSYVAAAARSLLCSLFLLSLLLSLCVRQRRSRDPRRPAAPESRAEQSRADRAQQRPAHSREQKQTRRRQRRDAHDLRCTQQSACGETEEGRRDDSTGGDLSRPDSNGPRDSRLAAAHTRALCSLRCMSVCAAVACLLISFFHVHLPCSG